MLGDAADFGRAATHAQHLVTGCVAEAVVDQLEPIEVQEEHRRSAGRDPVARIEVIFQQLTQLSPVGEAGEVVLRRADRELRGGADDQLSGPVLGPGQQQGEQEHTAGQHQPAPEERVVRHVIAVRDALRLGEIEGPGAAVELPGHDSVLPARRGVEVVRRHRALLQLGTVVLDRHRVPGPEHAAGFAGEGRHVERDGRVADHVGPTILGRRRRLAVIGGAEQEGEDRRMIHVGTDTQRQRERL